MRILVTNDDGITSEGISKLAAVAAETGMDVVIAAPAEDRSGSSSALSAVRSETGIRTDKIGIGSAPKASAYSVHASPALIAVLAAEGSFGTPPDLVLSGINHGPNTGLAVLHSGTVGAALTAALRGTPAIAFSFASPSPDKWDTAAIVARRLVRWATSGNLAPVVLNVNIPDVSAHDLRGIRAARLAEFGTSQARVDTRDRTETVTMNQPVGRPDPGSDAALLAAGWATVTAVMAPCELSVDLAGVADRPADGFARGR